MLFSFFGFKRKTLISIGVGRGPSGLSIEGPFCRAVHLCLAFGYRKIERKKKKKIERRKESSQKK